MTAPWSAAFAALTVTVLLLSLTFVGWLRKASATLEELAARLGRWGPEDMGGLLPGTLVPDAPVWDHQGRRRETADVLAGPCVMLLLEADCEPCAALVEDLWRAGWHSDVPLVAICAAQRPADGPDLPPPIRVFHQRDLAGSFGVRTVITPQAFALDGARRVQAKSIPNTTEHLEWIAGQLDEGGEVRAGGLGNPI